MNISRAPAAPEEPADEKAEERTERREQRQHDQPGGKRHAGRKEIAADGHADRERQQRGSDEHDPGIGEVGRDLDQMQARRRGIGRSSKREYLLIVVWLGELVVKMNRTTIMTARSSLREQHDQLRPDGPGDRGAAADEPERGHRDRPSRSAARRR